MVCVFTENGQDLFWPIRWARENSSERDREWCRWIVSAFVLRNSDCSDLSAPLYKADNSAHRQLDCDSANTILKYDNCRLVYFLKVFTSKKLASPLLNNNKVIFPWISLLLFSLYPLSSGPLQRFLFVYYLQVSAKKKTEGCLSPPQRRDVVHIYKNWLHFRRRFLLQGVKW